MVCRVPKKVSDFKARIQPAPSVAGIIIAAEDRRPVVQKKQNENEKQRDADGRPADPVDGVGFTSGEDGRDEGAAIGGEKLNGEKEDNGEKEKTERTEQLGDRFGDGFALVADKERTYNNYGDDHRQQDPMRCAGLPFFYHTWCFLRKEMI